MSKVQSKLNLTQVGRDIERVGAKPLPAVRHDGEHRQYLGYEDEPRRPVHDLCCCLPIVARRRVLDDEDGDREQGRDEHRQFEDLLDALGVVVHESEVSTSRRGDLRAGVRNPAFDSGAGQDTIEVLPRLHARGDGAL